MKRKFLCTILIAVCAICLICGLSGCGDPESMCDHEWSEWEITIPATCSAQGEETRICKLNSDHKEIRKTDINPEAHAWKILEVITRATCSAQGEETLICKLNENHKETHKTAIDSDSHTYGNDNICMDCNKPWNFTENLSYDINSDNSSYSVTGMGASIEADIVLPYFYNGLPVTSIADRAFENRINLKSVTIPNSIVFVGESAFKNCTSLTGVHINNIETWCNIEFNDGFSNPLYYARDLYVNNTLITELNIPQGVKKIKDFAFCCFSGTTVNIPDSVTSIGKSAFYGCKGLKDIDMPDSITSFGDRAFYECINLTGINFGKDNKLETIGEEAFFWCKSFTALTIPASVTSIGDWAFSGCDNLLGTYITDIAAWCNIDFGYSANPLGYTHNLYLNNILVTELNIPQGVKEIKDYAFLNCTSLKSITIPEGATSIGNSAFSGCENLTSVTVPDSVNSVGGSTFYGCKNLASINIPEGVVSIDEQAFSGCKSLISIDIPNSVTSICDKAFYGCANLKSVSFGNISKLKAIEQQAFYACSNLESVNIPDGVTSIGNQAFGGCDKIIQIQDGVKYVGKWVVDYDTIIATTELRDDTRGIADEAFRACENLINITIPNNLTYIGTWAFQGCKNLDSVTFENKTGWKISPDKDMDDAEAVNVDDDTNNARLLRSAYCHRYWAC